MVTMGGVVLIVELIAAAALVIALAGLSIRRTAPWLLCSVVALTALIAAAMLIVASST